MTDSDAGCHYNRSRTVLFILSALMMAAGALAPDRLPVHWPSVAYGAFIASFAHYLMEVAHR